jgi:hypothetical protein
VHVVHIGEQFTEELPGVLAEEAPSMPNVVKRLVPRKPIVASALFDLLVFHRFVPKRVYNVTRRDEFGIDYGRDYLFLEIEILPKKCLHPMFERVAKTAVADAVAIAATRVRHLSAPAEVVSHYGLKPFSELFDRYTLALLIADPAFVNGPLALDPFTEYGIFKAFVADVVRQDNPLMFRGVCGISCFGRITRSVER